MSLFEPTISSTVADLVASLKIMPVEDRIEALNYIRRALHEVSPFRNEPIDCVEWVKADTVEANDYNPNKVAPPEMRLLELSIDADGYTQPVVTAEGPTSNVVVDGFHRSRIAKEKRRIRERIHGRIPIVRIRSDRSSEPDRMAATIRHNRARGVHGVIPMTEVVGNMLRSGMGDADVAKALGMDAEELLRFKQNKGLPELFKDRPFSNAWE